MAASIGYSEASVLKLNPYAGNLIDQAMNEPEGPVVFCPKAHWDAAKNSSIITTIVAVVKIIFHHIRAMIFKSYKERFMNAAKKVDEEAIRVNSLSTLHSVSSPKSPPKSPLNTGGVDSPPRVGTPPSVDRAGETEEETKTDKAAMVEIVKNKMGERFGKFWENFISKFDEGRIKSWTPNMQSYSLFLKEPMKCRVPSDDPEIKHKRILMLLGAKKEDPADEVSIRFTTETITKDDQPREMKEEEFKPYIGKTMKTMEFLTGFYTFVHMDGMFGGTHYHPKMTHICYIDDEHVILKGKEEFIRVFSKKGDPRLRTMDQLEQHWVAESLVLPNDLRDEFALETYTPPAE